MTDLQFREYVFAINLATQAAIRALFISHPNRDALVKAFRFESEESLSLLLGKHVSDEAIDAFRGALKWMGPDQSCA